MEYRIGGAFPIEGNRWIISMDGWHGEHAPLDENAFVEFARSLPVKDIYKIISTWVMLCAALIRCMGRE